MTFIECLEQATKGEGYQTLPPKDAAVLQAFIRPPVIVLPRDRRRMQREGRKRVLAAYHDAIGASFWERLWPSMAALALWIADNLPTVIQVLLTIAPFII